MEKKPRSPANRNANCSNHPLMPGATRAWNACHWLKVKRLTKHTMADRPKILLVDDDQDMLDLYREILSNCQASPRFSTATSGPRGMAILEAEPYTLLVCDLNMPKMDGLQVLSIVRHKYPRHPDGGADLGAGRTIPVAGLRAGGGLVLAETRNWRRRSSSSWNASSPCLGREEQQGGSAACKARAWWI